MRLIKKGPKVDSSIDPTVRIKCGYCESIFEGRKKELQYIGLFADEKEYIARFSFRCPICEEVTVYNEKELEDCYVIKSSE